MSDPTLSISARSNLLALQTTQGFLSRTTNRLSTGLKVSKPIDDAAAFFAAAALTKRAGDQTIAQTNIQQTSQLLETSITGLASIAKQVQLLQGLLSSLATATDATSSQTLQNQYNTILGQIDNLATAASYQGVNLINTSTASTSVSFSGLSGVNDLSISAVRSDSAGLSLSTIAAGLFFTLQTTIPSQASRAAIAAVNSNQSVAARVAVNAAPSLASQASTAAILAQPSTQSVASIPSNNTNPSTPSQSSQSSVELLPSQTSRASFQSIAAAASAPSQTSRASIDSVQSLGSQATIPGVVVAAVNTNLITTVGTQIGSALAQLTAAQSTLGSTNAILAIRLEFSKSYVATLQSGAAGLTVADLNEESANLTSLQTAQSLGVVALSITSQAQQSLLRLF